MRRSVLVALSLLFATPAWASYTLTGKPKVSFEATGTVMDMEGVSNTVHVSDDGTTLTFAVPMKTVTTDNSLRDDHMHNTYCQVDQYPDVVVALSRDSFKLPASDGDKVSGTAAGTLTVHGVEQPVTVEYSAKRKDGTIKLKAGFKLDVSKHGIEIPTYLCVTLDPRMKASASLELIDG